LVGERRHSERVDHVAIDRFTGGALAGAKYDLEPEVSPTYRFRVFARDPEPWIAGLLLLCLRDLFEGELPVGAGARKGYGRATGKVLKWQEGVAAPVQSPRDGARLEQSGVYMVDCWDGLPCQGSPPDFPGAPEVALQELQERYIARTALGEIMTAARSRAERSHA
jgi:hypothetical protein